MKFIQNSLKRLVRASKVNLISLLGVSMIAAGLFGPWFNYNLPQRLGNSPFANAMAHFSVSPFIFAVTMTSTSNRSVYEDIEVLYQNSDFFYSEASSLIGLACFLGAITGFIGGYLNRPKTTLIGGFTSLISTLFFFLLLPSNVIFIGIKCSPTWGFWLSLFGSMIILFQSAIISSQ